MHDVDEQGQHRIPPAGEGTGDQQARQDCRDLLQAVTSSGGHHTYVYFVAEPTYACYYIINRNTVKLGSVSHTVTVTYVSFVPLALPMPSRNEPRARLAYSVPGTCTHSTFQERMTREVAGAVCEAVDPSGVGVVVEASHMCMVMRGVQKINSKTVTR